MDEDPKELHVEPEDNNGDPQIWSKTKLLAPMSYMNPVILASNKEPPAFPPTYEQY